MAYIPLINPDDYINREAAHMMRHTQGPGSGAWKDA